MTVRKFIFMRCFLQLIEERRLSAAKAEAQNAKGGEKQLYLLGGLMSGEPSF